MSQTHQYPHGASSLQTIPLNVLYIHFLPPINFHFKKMTFFLQILKLWKCTLCFLSITLTLRMNSFNSILFAKKWKLYSSDFIQWRWCQPRVWCLISLKGRGSYPLSLQLLTNELSWNPDYAVYEVPSNRNTAKSQ